VVFDFCPRSSRGGPASESRALLRFEALKRRNWVRSSGAKDSRPTLAVLSLNDSGVVLGLSSSRRRESSYWIVSGMLICFVVGPMVTLTVIFPAAPVCTTVIGVWSWDGRLRESPLYCAISENAPGPPR
jgi:hypothetical protein